MQLEIVGRSSSHFTRVVRVFAHELGVDYVLKPVADLSSRDLTHFAGNPALRIPVLETPEGPWFGALNICRALARLSASQREITWPEALQDRMAVNAQELVLQGMSTEVALIMQAAAEPGGAIATGSKAFESLMNSLGWLDANLSEVLVRVARSETLSFLEVTSYCFIAHLAFRKVVELGPYRALRAFCDDFGRRASAQATTYRYDFS